MNETRAQCITRHVRAALRGSGATMRAVADRAVDVYHSRTALQDRAIEFHIGATAAAYESAARANAQLVERMLNGTVRLPADLEEALVLALPDVQRAECLRDLAARYGLLAAVQPGANGIAQQMTTADMMLATGRLLTTLAPAYADGALDTSDAAHARRALPQVLDLQARLATLAADLAGVTQAGEPIRPNMRIAK